MYIEGVNDGDYCIVHYEGKNNYIVIWNHSDVRDKDFMSYYLEKNTNYFGICGSFRFNDAPGNGCRFIRKATEQEKAHLDACINANRYVDPSKIVNVELFPIW